MRRKIKIICVAMLSIALLTACKSTRQQATALVPWLQEKVSHVNDRYSIVTLYQLNGKPYYALFCKGPKKSFDMNRTTIYDTEGNEYLTLGGPRQKSEKEIAFFKDAIEQGVIWQSDVAKKEQDNTR